MKPNGSDLNQMLIDQRLGRPFTGPEEWRPAWDQIGAELAALPDDAMVDVPFDIADGDIDLPARGAAIEQAKQLEAAMQPVPTKIVCWRAATADVFPPDGDPTPFIGKTYKEPGFVSVCTHRDQITVPEGGRLLAVVVPAGIPAVFDPENHELVLAQGLTFRVVSVAPNGTTKVVVVAA